MRHPRYLALAGSAAAVAGLLAGCGQMHNGAGGSAGGRHGTGSASPAPTVGLAPAPAGLTDRIALASTRVRAGTPIRGTLIVTNHGRKTVNLTRACRPYLGVTLAGHGLPVVPPFPADCSGAPFLIKPGVTRLAVTVRTTYSGCTTSKHTAVHTPACLPGNRMPPLPAGRYQAVLIGSGDLPLPPATPVGVLLTAP